VLDALSAILVGNIVFAVITHLEGKLANAWKKKHSLSWMLKKRYET
jgi:hypothetical protein